MGIRPRAILAVFRRNFAAYFGSAAGYVFITIFIGASAFLAFSTETFFAANLADLSALNAHFHWLLVVFIPAITMGAWAEERKLGTDELLFTLPVRDVEVVLGKYLAAVGVYTVALVFALSHALVLAWLGDPDWGLLIANYAGYWVAGAALISLGLVASSLTANMTVGFILGTALCLAAVFSEKVLALLFGLESRLAQGMGVPRHFMNFTFGVIALPDLAYFAVFTAVFLYVNMVLTGKRHWSGGRDEPALGWHYLARAVCIIVAGFAVSILVGRWLGGVRADTTVERLNSISPETVALLKELPEERPIYVQAYVSPEDEFPKEYIQTRRNLLRMLRQFEAVSGGRVLATVRETSLFSPEARDAEERFNIRPQRVFDQSEGRVERREIFLGVAFTCGAEENVIEFMGRGLSVEYELARSVRVVAKAKRRVLGILKTEAQLLGGFDMQAMRQLPSWRIVAELKKQYEVREVAPDAEIPEDIDVLLVGLPSSLNQEQMDNLTEYVETGEPVLLMVDPLPIGFPHLSPLLPKRPPSRPYGPSRRPEPKGDIDALLRMMGLIWQKDRIVWDMYNPLPKFRDLDPELVFVGEQAGGALRRFARGEIVTSELSRLLFLFSGSVRESGDTTLRVVPLLRTGTSSGSLRWRQIMQQGFLGMSFRENRPHLPTGEQYILAARVCGKLPATAPDDSDAAEDDKAEDKEKEESAEERSVNAIVIADLDLISDTFFEMRLHGDRSLRLDNITFALNCVDLLAGDETLIALRSRRPRYHTLKTIEEWRQTFQDEKLAEEEQAEDEAKMELDEANKRLKQKLKELSARKDIDDKSKSTLLYNVKRVEEKRLKATEVAIEAKKQDRIKRAETEMRQGIRRIENRVRFWAVVLPPLPAILIGLLVFLKQLYAEKKGEPLTRSMRRSR